MRVPVTFLRHVALAEAVSYLLLLGVAMPLKYLAGQPLAVRVIGLVHGVLFLALCWALWGVFRKAGWPATRCLLVLAVSFVPVLPFYFDRRMRRWEGEAAAGHGAPSAA